MSETKFLTLEVTEFPSTDSLPSELAELIRAARSISQQSYSPYSNFKVGAAVRLQSGKIITGSNQENSAYPSGLCAERVALFYASAQHPDDPITAIAVTARRPNEDFFLDVTPCGGCRQVMCEYEDKQKTPITILMEGGNDRIKVMKGVWQLLPMRFTAEQLFAKP
jgi:cytidine deaminase